MLTLSQIRDVHDAVDDQWRSPVADAVAAAWGVGTGQALYWRSSASHVVVVPAGADPRGVLYVRWVPERAAGARGFARGTLLHARLSADAADVAPLVPSTSGRLLERLTTPLGPVLAAVVRRVDGDETDVDDLTVDLAAAWGRGLGRFHLAAARYEDVVEPAPVSPLAALARSPDTDVADAARVLADALGRGGPARTVVGHGDYELDNLRWRGWRPVCFDLDEAALRPAAADVASAVRDLLGPDPAHPAHPRLLDGFLDGYSRTSGTTVTHDALLPHVGALAAAHLADLDRILDTAEDAAWLTDLGDRLRAHAAGQREVLVASAAALA
ncbi:phosphotransferase enzyme family protein [Cellulomonas fimi]|uniref:phosphotransferase enzyme family protein n=1 Tax=Cellulomonas fimi TaxID=1708 RepID=UPI0002D85558|nr:hypothetical protein [Cellulomonas fimi]NNH07419.1 aminoglycoside phosphotransferase [Cellulomonas fimi]VEH36749.1 Uncharacterised protein [Cellulomonas fimi]